MIVFPIVRNVTIVLTWAVLIYPQKKVELTPKFERSGGKRDRETNKRKEEKPIDIINDLTLNKERNKKINEVKMRYIWESGCTNKYNNSYPHLGIYEAFKGWFIT